MKKLFTLIAALVFCGAGIAQELQETSFDFGKIPQGRPVTHVFLLKNTGKKPLLLENVQTSCGCTTPEWSQEPVKPGETTSIKVGFNAATLGTFNKSIAIVYGNNEVKNITIHGEVYAMPATSAPLQPSFSSTR